MGSFERFYGQMTFEAFTTSAIARSGSPQLASVKPSVKGLNQFKASLGLERMGAQVWTWRLT